MNDFGSVHSRANISTKQHWRNWIKSLSIFVIMLTSLLLAPFTLAQTLTGQQGSFTTPSADTYPAGHFSIGNYFRSTLFQPSRFDATSVYLITGISPSTEASFSFPGIWGNSTPPKYFEVPAQLSLKQKVYSNKNNQLRFAVEGLMQRRPMGQDTTYDQSANWGLGVIGSYTRDRNTFHLYTSHLLARGDKTSPSDMAGAGVDRIISDKVLFSADLYALSGHFLKEQSAFTTLMGLRYHVSPNFMLTAGGGLGITHGSFDWQYLIGIAFTTDLRKITYTSAAEIVPPIPSDRGGTEAMPGLNNTTNTSVGIPPPGTPEAEPVPAAHTTVKAKQQLLVNTRFFFDMNTFELSPYEQSNFDLLSHDLKKYGKDACLSIIGNSDAIGSNRENVALSLARAMHIAANIADSAGLLPENLIIGSAGKEKLSDPRKTDASHQLNRRVELKTCTRMSSQLDTLPEDSCIIRIAYKWARGKMYRLTGLMNFPVNSKSVSLNSVI